MSFATVHWIELPAIRTQRRDLSLETDPCTNMLRWKSFRSIDPTATSTSNCLKCCCVDSRVLFISQRSRCMQHNSDLLPEAARWIWLIWMPLSLSGVVTWGSMKTSPTGKIPSPPQAALSGGPSNYSLRERRSNVFGSIFSVNVEYEHVMERFHGISCSKSYKKPYGRTKYRSWSFRYLLIEMNGSYLTNMIVKHCESASRG